MDVCKICGNKDVTVAYYGPIRIGTGSKRAEKSYNIYQCGNCGTLWHDNDVSETYYETPEYRIELEGTTEIEEFYKKHDRENLDKFIYTGTDIFRGKIVADIGCGGGGWLDFLSGVASKTVAVEPSAYYRKHLEEKGHHAFAYMNEAFDEFGGKIDVLASFDVIEYVADPQSFVNDIFYLTRRGGAVIIGTPTDHRHLRELLGDDFNAFIFSVQHPWVFTEKSLSILFSKAGFQNIRTKFHLKYGLGNVFSWLKEKAPKGHKTFPCVSNTIDEAWKANLAETGYGDYLVMYAAKR